METAEQGFEISGAQQRLFDEFAYAAGAWKTTRRVIARPLLLRSSFAARPPVIPAKAGIQHGGRNGDKTDLKWR